MSLEKADDKETSATVLNKYSCTNIYLSPSSARITKTSIEQVIFMTHMSFVEPEPSLSVPRSLLELERLRVVVLPLDPCSPVVTLSASSVMHILLFSFAFMRQMSTMMFSLFRWDAFSIRLIAEIGEKLQK